MAPKKQALQQQQQRSQADGDGAISAAATSELWTIVLGSTGGASLLSFADVAVLARVCHGCFAATAAAKTKAQWAVARFGARTALAALYAQQPRLLTAAVVDALVAAGASLPRALVLLLVREKRAHQRYAKALDAHFKYQKDVKRQLEWRAMELEAQRLTNASKSETRALIDKSKASASKRDIHDLQMSEVEDDQNAPNNDTNTVLNDYADDAEDADEENNKTSIALVPLPSYAEIPHVPHPEAVQSTNSAFLKPGVRDYIIEVGEDIYGKVFFSSNAPLAYSERISLLPEELHWTANITQVVGLASPAGEWPFDDTAMFTFLIKYGLDVKSFLTTDAPKEVALIPTPENASDDGKSQSSNTRPSASVGYAVHRNQEAWRRICESIWVLIQKHGFVPEFVLGSILGPLKTFLRNGVALDASNVEEGSWILSEILHHDERLGRLLAKSAGIEGDVVENELYYWILIDSKVQQPPRRHAPLTAAEELHMRQTLAKLPLPIPVVPLRRFLSAHASRHSIQRICEYTSTPLETLKTIGEDLIASLTSLSKRFKSLQMHFLAHFTIPDYEMYTSAEAKVKPVTAAPAAADDLMDLMSAYAPVGPQLLTRVGALTGSLPWSFWNYLVTRYTSTPAWKSSAAAQQVLSILLHDLTVRRASSNDDDPARRWFGEKEADKALSLFLKALDGSDVVVFKATIVEVCKRVYESA
ncbi:hypothetical protein BDR26DRAFT_1007959 [Obelidium mucronatum]|nr:hypothetical protein BDR26DRAFT_1007959 [Obelidium mucronatum]